MINSIVCCMNELGWWWCIYLFCRLNCMFELLVKHKLFMLLFLRWIVGFNDYFIEYVRMMIYNQKKWEEMIKIK